MTTPTRTGWNPAGTFLGWPAGSLDDVKDGQIVVAGAPCEFTGSAIGPRLGPRAIRDASAGIDFRWREPGTEGVVDVMTGGLVRFRDDAPSLDVGDIPIFAPQLAETTESIRAATAVIAGARALPLILGGDHYISYPAILGVATARAGQKLGYIQLDAHLDLQDTNPNHGPVWHGSNARRVAELPEFPTRNMVWLGALDIVWRDEWTFAREAGCTILTMKDFACDGIAATVARAIEIAAHGTDGIYLTLDIDVIAHAHSPGTGFINVGGLTAPEFLQVLTLLGGIEQIAGIDLVEVTPPRDPSGVTAYLAALGLVRLLGHRIMHQSTSV